ncbi:MAG TPA: MarR family transcriptional regulator [Polyangia bacterium]|nr:MarR family transcriptional regulator [Polyangia bacterium]
MSRPKTAVIDDGGPLLGSLLRRAYEELQGHVEAGLGGPVRLPVLGAVGQPLFEHPEGLRPTQLAAQAGITKQSVGELIDAMEAAGYLERSRDPLDGRARLVRLTPLGRKVGSLARQRVREVEARWAERVGADRLEALRATLESIVAG